MKCVRDTGTGEYWSIWNRQCKIYKKQYGKKQSPFTRRWKTGKRLLHQLDIATRKHKTRKIYQSIRYRLLYFKLLTNKSNVKWQ
jgi:hypothetical protein